MTEAEADIGVICVVRDDVWRDFCLREQMTYRPFIPQPIVALPGHPPYWGYAMLAFCMWWWKLEELEVSDVVTRDAAVARVKEEVEKIMRKGLTGFIGSSTDPKEP